MPKADYGAEDKLTQGRHDPITWEFAGMDARHGRHARPMQLNAPRSRALLHDSISNNW